MGINKGIINLVKKLGKEKGIDYEKTFSMNDVEGVIAVDFYLYLHKLFFVGSKVIASKLTPPFRMFEIEMFEYLINSILTDIEYFHESGCTLVFVFERTLEWITKAKLVKKSRKDKVDKEVDKYLSVILNVMESGYFDDENILFDNDDDDENILFDEIESHSDNSKRDTEYINEYKNLEYIVHREKDVQNLRNAFIKTVKPSLSLITKIFEFLKEIDIPVLISNCEGEKMCVMLREKGFADYVYSSDTDCLAMGSRYTIKNVDKRTKSVQIVFINRILKILEMSNTQFMDLCIMCGCDFNTNIPKLGPVTAYNYIKDARDYEDIYSLIDRPNPNTRKPLKMSDFECINYELCRKLFDIEIDIQECIIDGSDSFYSILNGYDSENSSDQSIDNRRSSNKSIDLEEIFERRLNKHVDEMRSGIKNYVNSNR